MYMHINYYYVNQIMLKHTIVNPIIYAQGWAEDGLAEEEAAMREGAPLHLLDHVIAYLAGERAKLRADVRGGAEQQTAEAAGEGAVLDCLPLRVCFTKACEPQTL